MPHSRTVVGLERYWAGYGQTVVLTQFGWLAPQSKGQFYSVNSHIAMSKELAHLRCLVLLGEPGMGKTMALDKGKGFQPDPSVPILHFDLGMFGSEDRLVSRVFESADVMEWRDGQGDLCLNLDGFDEALGRIDTLPHLLVDFLARSDCTRLFLRIACRTANWPSYLQQTLKEEFGDGGVHVQVLQPLRRDDALALLDAAGADSEALLVTVETARVVPLAARPLTLNLLHAVSDSVGGPPQSASTLYEKGLLALADVTNPLRLGTGFAAGTASERLRLASRIAAISTLGGRPSIWIGPIAEAESTAITVDECQPPDFVARAHATVAEVVDGALQSGLFTRTGESYLGWSHATFADYLAARWMRESALSDQQIDSLLFAEDGKVYPRMRQVASWLVAMQPARFRSFVSRDPQAFLQNTDIPDDSLRAELVDALFSAAREGLFYDDYRHDLTGVGHPGLVVQVREALAGQSHEVKRLAVRIANQCQLTEVVPDLVSLALDEKLETGLRISAVLDVRDLAKNNPTGALVRLLKPLSTSGAARPIDQDLEGAVLMASWPHAITTTDVFATIRARQHRNVLGFYFSFLNEFAAALKDADLGAACDWITSVADTRSDDRFGSLIDVIVCLCVRNLDDPRAHLALRHVAYQRIEEYEPLIGEHVPLANFELDDEQRRRLALVLLGGATNDQARDMCSLRLNGGLLLISEADFEWFVGQYGTADDVLRPNIGLVLPQLFRPARLSHSETVLRLSANDAVAQVFATWRRVVDLDSPEALEASSYWSQQADRRRAHDLRRATETDDAWVNPKITAHARSALNGDMEAYWEAVRLVAVQPGGRRLKDEYQPDLTEHPRWNTLPPTTRSNLVSASVDYLRDGRCEPDRWLDKDIQYHPACAGYRALVLLLRERPAALDMLTPESWRKWAPIIIDWPVAINAGSADDKTALVEMAAAHARPQLNSTLLVLIDRAIAQGRPFFRGPEVTALMSDELASELLARLERPMSRESRDSLLDALLASTSDERVDDLLLSWIGDEQRVGDRDRAADAAMRLLRRSPTLTWSRLRALLETDPEFVKSAFLANHFAYDRKAPNVDDTSLREIYLSLRELFPPAEDPPTDEVHFVGPREAIATWRDSLLGELKQRGTTGAVQAIREICDALPGEPWLKQVLMEAERSLRESVWQPVSVEEIDRLAASRTIQLIRTDAELRDAVLVALDGIQARLQGDTPAAHLLWDTHAGRPKTEDEISDYLYGELTNRLGQTGAIVNREVQVRRVKPSGLPERTDLRFETAPTGESGALKIPGEVKGVWNSGVIKSIGSQLVGRYMADLQTEYGVYIVVWFDRESWVDASDGRRNNASRFASIDDLRVELEKAAKDSAGEVSVVVLNASIRRGA